MLCCPIPVLQGDGAKGIPMMALRIGGLNLVVNQESNNNIDQAMGLLVEEEITSTEPLQVDPISAGGPTFSAHPACVAGPQGAV